MHEIHNPNCDGGQCANEQGEVRRLPWSYLDQAGSGAALILCRACYEHEMAFRQERNRELAPEARFDLPAWEALEVYVP
jgi:hypothetical protein